jgi:hypothetical protein
MYSLELFLVDSKQETTQRTLDKMDEVAEKSPQQQLKVT